VAGNPVDLHAFELDAHEISAGLWYLRGLWEGEIREGEYRD
jgi:hypothetical protein